MALGIAMALPFLSALFYFVIFSDQEFAKWIYAATKVFMVVWPLFCLRLLPFANPGESRTGILPVSSVDTNGRRVPRPALRRRLWRGEKLSGCLTRLRGRSSPRRTKARNPLGNELFKHALSGILIGGLIVAGMFLVMQTPVGQVVTAGAANIHRKVEQLGILRFYWPFALFLSVVNSLMEEYYWRWFVFGRLREMLRIGPALLLANTAFAAHHVVVLSQYFPLEWAWLSGCAVGGGGAIWCVMFERQRTVMGAWISHVIADFGIMTIGYQILMQN